MLNVSLHSMFSKYILRLAQTTTLTTFYYHFALSDIFEGRKKTGRRHDLMIRRSSSCKRTTEMINFAVMTG